MRVAFVVSGLNTGGAEMMLYKLLKALPRERCEPLVISLGARGRPAELIGSLGVQIVGLDLGGSLVSYLRAPLRVRSALRHFNPELISGWMAHGNVTAWVIAKALRVPLVWNIRQTLHLSGEKPHTRCVIRAAAKLSHAPKRIIYVSALAREQHRRLGYEDGKARVLPNGFEIDIFHRDEVARARVRKELEVSEATCVIGHLGRDHPMKDQLGLLRAARTVIASEPNVLFVLAGSGVDDSNSKLAGAIKENQLSEHVRLLGDIADPEALLSACDLFCLPSAWGEGFPNAVGEAMACELPCVVTEVGEGPAVVGSTGQTVAPTDYDALAAALLKFVRLEPAARRLVGKRARQRIVEYFSLPNVAAQYAAVFDEALQAS